MTRLLPRRTAALAVLAPLLVANSAPALPRAAMLPLTGVAAAAPVAGRCDGLSVSGGRVVAARHHRSMVGFAAEAGTRGGVGQALLTVTNARTDEAPGSLRAMIERARALGGGYIVFAPSLAGATLAFDAPLRLSSHTSLDGGCAAPRLVGTGRGSLIYARSIRDVVISRLDLSQSSAQGEEGGDCVTISHGTDQAWVAFNRIHQCRDGLVDITRNDGGRVRATVSNNQFADHDKAMLIDDNSLPGQCRGAAGVNVTVFRNRFTNTGQRHPRVAGNAFVHVAQNEVDFRAQRRARGDFGAAYGVYASNGARVVVEDYAARNRDEKAHRLVMTSDDGGEACGPAAIRTSRITGSGRLAPGSLQRTDTISGPGYRLPGLSGALGAVLDRETGPRAAN